MSDTEPRLAPALPRVDRVQFSLESSSRGALHLREGPPRPVQAPPTAPARVARMLAFALDVRDQLERGVFCDQADAARTFRITRARLSQLMDLTLLAPDLQEQILAMRAGAGRQPINERTLRAVAANALWAEQRTRWSELCA